MITIGQDKKQMKTLKICYKEIAKKEIRKYSTSTYVTALSKLSNRTDKKDGTWVVGGRQREKNEYLYLKLKQENNIRKMVLKIYL